MDVRSTTIYYPSFGSVMQGRAYSSTAYRFGFNGKEKEADGTTDNYDFGARIYDGRLGRFSSVDPLHMIEPYQSPFSFVDNCPNIFIDKTGKTRYKVVRTINEATGETMEIKTVVNDDLEKNVIMKTETTNFLNWTATSEVKDRVEWNDINEVTTITIDKNGNKSTSKTTEKGNLRFTNNPILDDIGYNSTQDAVNDEISSTNSKWGGIHWTWSNGQGGESRRGAYDDASIRVEDIDNLMDILTGASPNNFNIPETIVANSDVMTVINVFYESIDKSVASVDFVSNLVETTKQFINEVKGWKEKNTVKNCQHGTNYIYNSDGTLNNVNGEIPKDKVLSKDIHV